MWEAVVEVPSQCHVDFLFIQTAFIDRALLYEIIYSTQKVKYSQNRNHIDCGEWKKDFELPDPFKKVLSLTLVIAIVWISLDSFILLYYFF